MATTPASAGKGNNNTSAAQDKATVAISATMEAGKKEENGQKQKPELSTAHVVAEKQDLPPLEDRVMRVQQLFDLVERHESLTESKKKIDSFKFASDGQRDTLTIEDSKGNEFTTSNSAVIQACVALIKTTLAEKIAEVDQQIRLS